MTQTRRTFLATAAGAGTITVLPWGVSAMSHGGADTFATDGGEVSVHPINHASFVMQTPTGVIHVDPVGDAALYADYPAPDLILITHEHGDHYNAETLSALMADGTHLITNPAVHDMLPDELASGAETMANGDSSDWNGVSIDAIPAYNTTPGRENFHPQGRDNGYVLTIDGFRVYISGDTEDIPEMRALENIDLAFVCMNLPFTMDVEQAAAGVNAFGPAYVYPYHYQGRDDGTQDPEEFAEMLRDGIEAKMGDWYG